MELITDPTRDTGVFHESTSIYVRAFSDREQTWVNADIAELDPVSLLAWLRSRGGRNEYAERVVFHLLSQPWPEDDDDDH